MNNKLSVVLATFNEEMNIAQCLKSVEDIADEIIVVDGSSTDNTAAIARNHGAIVIVTKNHPIFHINKQKAMDLARFPWVLQLDADERVSKSLASEIVHVINMSNQEIEEYQKKLKDKNLFLRHQKLLEQRDGNIGTEDGLYAAFFIPRLNFFLGKYLHFGGVYPDGVIRLVKKDNAHFPQKSVHEQIEINGKVGWLQNPLFHHDSPTFERYIKRNARYVDLIAMELKKDRKGKNLWQILNYIIFKPIHWFLLTQIRHKGILDGYQGLIFSFFSALRFPKAYIKYFFNQI